MSINRQAVNTGDSVGAAICASAWHCCSSVEVAGAYPTQRSAAQRSMRDPAHPGEYAYKSRQLGAGPQAVCVDPGLNFKTRTHTHIHNPVCAHGGFTKGHHRIVLPD